MLVHPQSEKGKQCSMYYIIMDLDDICIVHGNLQYNIIYMYLHRVAEFSAENVQVQAFII